MATEPELESALHYLGLGYSTSPKSSAVDEPSSLYQIAHGLAVCPIRLQSVHAVSKHHRVHYFETPPRVTYYAYADDFGPYNLAGVITFGRHVRSLRENLGVGATLALCTGEPPRALANGLFLLGAFLILDADMSPDEVHARVFARIDEADVESYRDILPTEATFRLPLIDCWRALARAKGLGWVSLEDGEGRICIDEYRHRLPLPPPLPLLSRVPLIHLLPLSLLLLLQALRRAGQRRPARGRARKAGCVQGPPRPPGAGLLAGRPARRAALSSALLPGHL